MTSQELVACYRLYAANCVEIAKGISDPNGKVALLGMAKAWMQMANQIVKHTAPAMSSATDPGPPDH